MADLHELDGDVVRPTSTASVPNTPPSRLARIAGGAGNTSADRMAGGGDLRRSCAGSGHNLSRVHVDIAHLAATPWAVSVTCEAEVVKVDGLRVTLHVSAGPRLQRQGDRDATGSVDRVVVDVERFPASISSEAG